MMIWIDGQAEDTLSARSRGLAYADGVFETIAVHKGRALLWEQHLARLQRGLQALNISCEISTLQEEVKTILAYADERAVLKIILVRSSDGQRGFRPAADAQAVRIVQLLPANTPSPQLHLMDCRTPLVSHPCLHGLKTLNALQYVLASAELGEYDDGVLCDLQGQVVETTRANLFWVDPDGVLVTADLRQGGIEGVVRAEILRRAPARGIDLQLRRAPLAALAAAREIFVTNSLLGVQSVTRYGGRELRTVEMAETIRELLGDDIFATD